MRQCGAKSMVPLASGLFAALSLVTGCGTAEDADSSRPPVEQTRTVVLDPFDREGEPVEGRRVTNEVSARCEPSVLSPENELARRCFTNETSVALDPCFVPADPLVATDPHSNPTAALLEVETTALCLADPAQDDLTRAYVLEDNGDQKRASAPFDPHWFLELADGTRCTKAFGVREIRQRLHLSYNCDDGVLYGIPDEDKRVWTIHHLPEDADELRVAEVRTAWS